MHTRRIATFLLGAWLGCSVFVAFLMVENLRSSSQVLTIPSPQAGQFIKKLALEDATLLLQYHAAEQNRSYLYNWEIVQMVVGAVLLLFLFSGTQRKILPALLCGAMILMSLFQHFALSPEMTFRGREADFPPGNHTFNTQARLWAIQQVYIGSEGAKLLLGGVLASYLFVFRAGERRRRRKVDAIDHPDHSHVNG